MQTANVMSLSEPIGALLIHVHVCTCMWWPCSTYLIEQHSVLPPIAPRACFQSQISSLSETVKPYEIGCRIKCPGLSLALPSVFIASSMQSE